MIVLQNELFEISLTIQVCGRPCTWWKAGSWGCGFSLSPQHTCTHAHPRDISSGYLIHKHLEWGALVIILKVKDEAEPHIRVDMVLKSQVSMMQELWVPAGATDVSEPEMPRYLGKGLGIHKMKSKWLYLNLRAVDNWLMNKIMYLPHLITITTPHSTWSSPDYRWFGTSTCGDQLTWLGRDRLGARTQAAWPAIPS